MMHASISVTELARNITANIDNVRISGHSIYITKGSQTVAELCPPPKPGLSVDKLIDLLHALPRLGDDAAVMANDLAYIRKQAVLPKYLFRP